MSHLRIKQFQSVQTSSPYQGEKRKANISVKLLNVLREQSLSERENKHRNSSSKIMQRDAYPTKHSSFSNKVSK